MRLSCNTQHTLLWSPLPPTRLHILSSPRGASPTHHPELNKRPHCAHSHHTCLHFWSGLLEVCVCWVWPHPEFCNAEGLFVVCSSSRGVGCILYEMVTGRPMFPGATVKEELHLIFRLMGKIAAGCNILQASLKTVTVSCIIIFCVFVF